MFASEKRRKHRLRWEGVKRSRGDGFERDIDGKECRVDPRRTSVIIYRV